MIVRFTPDAEAEFAEACQWYAQQRKDLDFEFMECIDEALVRVVRDPDLYPIVYRTSDAPSLGVFPLPSFTKSQVMRFWS